MSIATGRVPGRPRGFWVGVGLKSTLAVLLALPLINPGWQQYEDKGMYWRLFVFPLAGLVVPLAWHLAGRRRPYPYLADGLVLVVPLTDVLWNTLDAYDRVWWWDDAVHLSNSVVIAAVIGLWLRGYPLGPVARFCLVLGAGVTLAVAWELAEFPTFLHGSDELTTAYEDTLGDLALAFVGSTLAALIAARRPSADVAHDAGASETALALGSR